jgi:hypothetical protein
MAAPSRPLRAAQAATFSLLAFYIASAAYRAFRVRSLDAALMMLAAFVVMLGQVPIGRWLTGWVPNVPPVSLLRLENLGEWVMRWWNSPAQRAIALGVAVGALAMSLRIWLSLSAALLLRAVAVQRDQPRGECGGAMSTPPTSFWQRMADPQVLHLPAARRGGGVADPLPDPAAHRAQAATQGVEGRSRRCRMTR